MSRDAGRVPQDEPLAYFLTWTTYGSWLPGDERGWVAKPGEFLPPDAHLEQASRSLMTEPQLILDSTQRELVENTIADHCRHRGWHCTRSPAAPTMFTSSSQLLVGTPKTSWTSSRPGAPGG